MGKVFIIDDDKDFRDKLKKSLDALDVETFEAPEALEVANILMRERSGIDVIVLDLQIAEIDGRDIYELICEYVGTSIPVIVSSILPFSVQKTKIPRARDYYNKADSIKVLTGKIKLLLGIGSLVGR